VSCRTDGGKREKRRGFQRANLKEEPFGRTRLRKKDTIKMDLKWNGRGWTAFIWLRMRLSGWFLRV
jgi:hypothetical protein